MPMIVSTGNNGRVFVTPENSHQDFALTPFEALDVARELIEAAMAEIRLAQREK